MSIIGYYTYYTTFGKVAETGICSLSSPLPIDALRAQVGGVHGKATCASGAGYTYSPLPVAAHIPVLVNYYDTFNFLSLPGFSSDAALTACPIDCRSKLIGSMTGVYGSNMKLYSVFHYNVKGHIQRKSDLREYYSSVFSSFKVENGNCIHEEDQEFLDKVTEAIERNITNPDLSVELLISDLGYSTRQFYRKLKPLTEKSPADIIKEYRLVLAERLLLTKNLTTEEIMDQTGFNSRGTFYKLFTQRFGMPPRQYKEQQMNNVKGGQSGCDSPNVDSDKI